MATRARRSMQQIQQQRDRLKLRAQIVSEIEKKEQAAMKIRELRSRLKGM